MDYNAWIKLKYQRRTPRILRPLLSAEHAALYRPLWIERYRTLESVSPGKGSPCAAGANAGAPGATATRSRRRPRGPVRFPSAPSAPSAAGPGRREREPTHVHRPPCPAVLFER